MNLLSQLLDLPYTLETEYDQRADRGKRVSKYRALNRPSRVCAKVKTYNNGRVETCVRTVDLQRILNQSFVKKERTGKRVRASAGLENPDSIRRAFDRARSKVRELCLQINADHLVTFTTRRVMPLADLLVRWDRFRRAFKKHLAENNQPEFQYVAVPEFHADGEHYHLHVAVNGRFDVRGARPIWHAITANDFPVGTYDSDVHGNIDAQQIKVEGNFPDVPGRIASYISKYIGKSLAEDFNRKKYYASRISPAEVNQIILEASDFTEAQAEISRRLGFQWDALFTSHRGSVFVFPGDTGFWFKLVPDCPREPPPF